MRTTYNLKTYASSENLWHLYSTPALWPRWHYGLSWVHFEGPFEAGSRGIIKPRRGAQFEFCITDIKPGLSFAVMCYLPKAYMLISTVIQPEHSGEYTVSSQVTISGPLGPLFDVILGHQLKKQLPRFMKAFAAYACRTDHPPEYTLAL